MATETVEQTQGTQGTKVERFNCERCGARGVPGTLVHTLTVKGKNPYTRDLCPQCLKAETDELKNEGAKYKQDFFIRPKVARKQEVERIECHMCFKSAPKSVCYQLTYGEKGDERVMKLCPQCLHEKTEELKEDGHDFSIVPLKAR